MSSIVIPCFSCFGDTVAGVLQEKVAELVSLLWDWTLGWPTNLILVRRNARALREEMRLLKEMGQDMNRKVQCEETQPSMERMSQVEGWLHRVRDLEIQVSDFLAALDSRQILFVTGFSLGHQAVENLKRVRELKEQAGNLGEVVGTAAPDADTLDSEMAELRVVRDDLRRRVDVEEARDVQMRRRDHVEEWLEAVDALDAEVRAAAGAGPPGYAEVADKLRRVRKLRREGNFEGAEVVSRVLRDAIEAVPGTSASSIVRGEETLTEIRAHLSNNDVGIIGVCGMGGIGKTTLLKKINDELLRTTEIQEARFNMVIWVSLPRGEIDVSALQKEIGMRVGLDDSDVDAVFRALSRKKFLLLLDNLWEPLDLENAGIPTPDRENGCKIVFTTRSKDVCADMDAQPVKMELLGEAQSWELFRKMVRADAVLKHPYIHQLARRVVAQCGGLPLALVTSARAMANKKLPEEWEDAVKALEDSPQELRGMEGKVLNVLKFSFDGLPNDTLRRCLLYCCLFPENHDIYKEQLIAYWNGEGFLDGDAAAALADIDSAHRRGRKIIERLQAACLVESGNSVETLRLHDAVRDMTLWLTGGTVKGYEDRFLIHAGRGPSSPLPGAETWGGAQRISFMRNTNLLLPAGDHIPHSPNTKTLLMNGNPHTTGVCDALFLAFPMLCVLDMSSALIYHLPAAIASLVQLKYLNISFTRMVDLPRELGSLVNLRQLVMVGTIYLTRIPLEAFSNLSKLQVLNMYRSGYKWSWEPTETGGEQRDRQVCLGDLGSLDRPNELGLTLTSLTCLDRSERYARSIKRLSLTGIPGLTPGKLQLALRSKKGLQVLEICGGDQLDELHLGRDDLRSLKSLVLKYLPLSTVLVAGGGLSLCCLQRLEITRCHTLRHVTWAGRLPCLESIRVGFCNNIEELLIGSVGAAGGEDTTDQAPAFPMLRVMYLSMLPRFWSISPRPLLMPCLENLQVYGCPKLKKLPFGVGSAQRLTLIKGNRRWWDRLHWDDEGVKHSFISHFFPCGARVSSRPLFTSDRDYTATPARSESVPALQQVFLMK